MSQEFNYLGAHLGMDCCQKGLYLINLDFHWRIVESIYINKEKSQQKLDGLVGNSAGPFGSEYFD